MTTILVGIKNLSNIKKRVSPSIKYSCVELVYAQFLSARNINRLNSLKAK